MIYRAGTMFHEGGLDRREANFVRPPIVEHYAYRRRTGAERLHGTHSLFRLGKTRDGVVPYTSQRYLCSDRVRKFARQSDIIDRGDLFRLTGWYPLDTSICTPSARRCSGR